MVDQEEGEGRMTVRVPMDSMRRVTVREQDYFYHWIPGFSLGLALPNNYQVMGGLQLGHTNSIDGWFIIFTKIDLSNISISATKIFSGDSWRVHPDWVYCSYSGSLNNATSKEENLMHFLEKIDATDNWNWDTSNCKQALLFDIAKLSHSQHIFKSNPIQSNPINSNQIE